MFKLIRNKDLNNLVRSVHTDKNYYDVIVAGGGMVGSALTLALTKNKHLCDKRILLLEGRPKAEFKLNDKFSPRVSAINGTTVELFQNLGVWQHIEKLRFKPVTAMHVWDGCSNAQITFNNQSELDKIAYIVENNIILHSIEQELVNSKALTSYSAKCLSFKIPKHENELAQVILEDNTTLSCKLLIGADGGTSRIRKEMGVHYLTWPYDQKSIIANIRLAEPIANTIAYQKFTPNGPIALLPLSDTEMSLVWSTTVDTARNLMKIPNDQFVDALNDALWEPPIQNEIVTNATKFLENILGRSSNCPRAIEFVPKCVEVEEKSRACFPIVFGHATNYIGFGTALIGDAAHRVHPLAGQGVNIGFKDVEILSKLMGESVYRGGGVGSIELLSKYEQESQKHNIPLVFGIDALYKLYSTSVLPVVLMRSLGLQVVDAVPAIKKVFQAQAGG